MLLPLILPELDGQSFSSRLLEGLNSQELIQAYNMNQSARALVAAWLWQKTGKSVLIISQDDIIAEDIWDDLCTFVGKENAFYLPDYEILPYEERSPHYSIRATRMICLNEVLKGKAGIYSLSIRALVRYIPPKEYLSKHFFTLKTGMEIDLDELSQKLFNMGYESQYQVGKVFETSRRGGIVDIFSPPALKPVRLEFFGDEIVSMRYFSANTQRSEPGDIGEMTVIPARELCLDDIDPQNPFASQIIKSGFFEGIENQYGSLLSEVSTFAHYFEPSQRLLIFNNLNYVLEEYQELTEQVYNQYNRELKHKTKAKLTPPQKLMASEELLYQMIQARSALLLSQSEFALPIKNTLLRTSFEPQVPMGGDLNLLAAKIRENQSLKRKTILLFDNKSQSIRTQQLLQDYDLQITAHIGSLHTGFGIGLQGPLLWTDHEIFNVYKRKRYTPRFSPGEQITDYDALKPGDYVVHIEHGIGVFEGLQIIRLDGSDTECLVLRYANDDRVYLPTYQLDMVSKYVAEESAKPTLHRIGGARWQNTKRKAAQVIELLAADIVRLYAERSARKGIAHKADGDWQKQLESSFLYEDTPDQARSTMEIKADMEAEAPMERLLCGDVGFGKTEVAIRAAFKAVVSGTQVGVLVPTTLLAEQHFRVFKERLAHYPIKVAMLSRFRSKQILAQEIADINSGKVDIAIGTHRLLSKDVRFKNLGLLIIDEEHRFGVRHKERLRKMQSNVDTLYMSATPIPRTLNMALAKLKEISLMQTSPKERLPIRTIITPRNTEVIKDAIRREVDRGGQVFFIHNRVQTIEHVADELRNLLPNVSFNVGHAQMSENHLEEVMNAFVNKEFQVLISTTIVENGLDIPNANTILIDRADTFGLAQLYQMRGRVGRSNRRAYCYLLIPKGTTTEARHRLEALSQYDFLGAGFQVALRDLELRGAGAILGTKQSGVIQAIGFNYYNSLLEKAVTSSGENKAISLEDEIRPKQSTTLKTEIDIYFPNGYIDNDEQRLNIYKRLSSFEKPEQIDEMLLELQDRFGSPPDKARWLLQFFKLDLMANRIGLSSCKVQRNKLIMQWPSDKMPTKTQILTFSSKVEQALSFDGSKGLKIEIELDKNQDYGAQFEEALRVLKHWK